MGKRKTGLGDNPLDWIADTSQAATAETAKPKPMEQPQEVQKYETAEVPREVQNSRSSEVPKFKTFDVKLSILLRDDQLEFLEKLTRDIMANRDSAHKQERITKNTVLRACIDALNGVTLNIQNISDEEELRRRIAAGMQREGRRSIGDVG